MQPILMDLPVLPEVRNELNMVNLLQMAKRYKDFGNHVQE